ncbi:MAG: hypothetical protein QHH05_09855 [Syntrophomonadaceae bacterium]|nr:hypothetical protein [Syntrophomonadaceae bacterium]
MVAHRQELPAVEQGVSQLTADYLYGLRYRPVKVDLVLEGRQGQLAAGELVLNWVHTPGHTAGSICLYVDLDGCRVLFGQDIHGPFNRSWGSDLAQWRQSMERLLALQADVLCEGHYGVISPAAEVERFIRRHLNLHR